MLGVCGSIAAYKVAELARNLTLSGAVVDVIMTEAAKRFIGPTTFQALTGRPVQDDMWELPEDGVVGHISLATQADLVVIAPATAHTIAMVAAGMCDTLLTTVVLATRAPVLCVPAMNPNMYTAAATQDNIATLRQRGMMVMEPEEGRMAEAVVGKGRLPEAPTIEGEIRSILGRESGALRRRHVVVTAGGTREPIDPVRFIGNSASGTMGYALASVARDLGANVTLITGMTALTPPVGIQVIQVESARDMATAVNQACEQADILLMNAAVADFRPADMAEHKIKKDGDQGMTITLVPNPDILAEMAHRQDVFKVGFAVETEDLLANAHAKLIRKGLHMIIANDAVNSIGQPDIQVTLLDRKGNAFPLPRQAKHRAAEVILHTIIEHFFESLGSNLLPEKETKIG